jgi:hypothetical protein
MKKGKFANLCFPNFRKTGEFGKLGGGSDFMDGGVAKNRPRARAKNLKIDFCGFSIYNFETLGEKYF